MQRIRAILRLVPRTAQGEYSQVSPPCMHRSTAANGAERCCPWESSCRLGEQSGLPMTVSRPDEKTLLEAFSIIEDTPNIDGVVIKLRDLLRVDHVVYHSSKLGASPSDPQRGPYIRLTYPAAW